MKKSEALEKLKKQLWLLGVPDLSDYDAESLLRFVEEELGMEHVIYMADRYEDWFGGEFEQGWEPEDD